MSSIVTRIIYPSDCSLAIGIPTDESGFYEARARDADSNALRYLGGWVRYAGEVCTELSRLIAVCAEHNVVVRKVIRRGELHVLFDDPSRSVVLLACHCDHVTGALELSDGFISVNEFVANIPSAFEGIIDFCACAPVAVARALHIARPQCVVRYARTQNTPFVWLTFYAVLLRALATGQYTYFGALEQVLVAFVNTRTGAKEAYSMPNLASGLFHLLKTAGLTDPITLGSAAVAATSDQRQRLRELLDKQRRFNDGMLLVTMVIVVTVFALSTALAIYYRSSPRVMATALGGNVLSILMTATWMRRLWVEKGLVDLATIAIEDMDPTEALRFAATIYWGLLAPGQKRQRRGNSAAGVARARR